VAAAHARRRRLTLSRPGARVLCLAGDELLLLLWRDPVGGREVWEPPGGGIERGESPEATARRELREEAGLEAGELHGPLTVARDYSWRGRRIVCDDVFFLARWDSRPRVKLEPNPQLLRSAWVTELDAVGPLEPPSLPAVLSSLRSGRPSPPSR